jgi:non-specific serine/threonine protein kinase
LAHGLQWSAELAEREGDSRRASLLSREALSMFRELGGRYCLAESLGDAAHLLAMRGDKAAVTLLAAADRARELIGLEPGRRESQRLETDVALARARVTEREFDTAWGRGRAMELERALDLALTAIGAQVTDGVPAAASRPAVRLTNREMEITELIAEGLTNAQIARRLVIGERTVDTHVENLLNKLDFATRAQVAVWVTERRLRASTE